MNSSQSIVSTKSGRVEGFVHNGLHVFKGIPYAAPPVGRLRWQPPQPVEPWSGVRPAGEYGPISWQNVMAAPPDTPGFPDFGHQPMNEDCLSLNIWTPGLDDARRAVLVWIHGGAFLIGSGTEGFLEDGVLARRGDVVVVSINYRLGALGFINLKEVTNGRIPATGNEGLLDQVAALEWVRDNIAAFGGDPGNVTVGGFSAGGMSIGTLLAMPAARGTFQKAMNRSGAANVVETVESAAAFTARYLELLGIKSTDIDKLYDLSPGQLMDAQQELGVLLRSTQYRATPFQPVIDGSVVPEMPIVAIRNGSAKNITLMAGNMRDEMKSTYAMDPNIRAMDRNGVIQRLSLMLPDDFVPGLVDTYAATKTARGETANPPDVLGAINTDLMFRIPTIRLVEAQRDNGAKAYNYLFLHRSPALGGALGAIHGLDNPFLFGDLDDRFTGNTPELMALAEKVQDSAVAFMKTGDPSCESAGKWPVYGSDRATMLWDADARVEDAPFEEERAAWDGHDILNFRPM
jgi:para-nitrobenzyl esterase